jgi:hypothetical protein
MKTVCCLIILLAAAALTAGCRTAAPPVAPERDVKVERTSEIVIE